MSWAYADDVEPEEPITLEKVAAAVSRLGSLGVLRSAKDSPFPWHPDLPSFLADRSPWMVRAPADQLPEGVAKKLAAFGIPSTAGAGALSAPRRLRGDLRWPRYNCGGERQTIAGDHAVTPREYFGRLLASEFRLADSAGETLRSLTGPDDSFPLIVEPPRQHLRGARRVLSYPGDDRQPLPQGDRPMQTPHEAAVAHLKELDRADHSVVEEVLAVVRQYPVDVQQACEAERKRGADASFIDPVKAVADRQAVEIQELLDALTSPATDAGVWRNQPSPFDLMHEVREPVVIASEPFRVAEPPFSPFREGIPTEADLAADKAERIRANSAKDRALDDLAHEPLVEHPIAVAIAANTDHPSPDPV